MRKFERDADNRISCDDDPGEWLTKAMKRPNNFGYFGNDTDTMFVTWSLGPVIEHRDSEVLDRSNAKALRIFLGSDPSLADDWRITSCTHWAVGHVDHLSFRAYEDDKKTPTRIARILCAWFEYLREQYPIADEDLFSEMESEEAERVWTDCYSDAERIEYIRKHRRSFSFSSMSDLMGCVRGKWFGGESGELLQ